VIAEVTTIYERNARDVVTQLRAAADSIEAGLPFDVRGAVFVLASRNTKVDVYSWGDLDNYSTLGVLSRAVAYINRFIDPGN
jgi:hypothetical protein